MSTTRENNSVEQTKFKVIPLTEETLKKEKDVPVSSPVKKALMKSLFVLDFESSEVRNKKEKVFLLSNKHFNFNFYLRKNNSTNEMALYQDEFLLDNNQYNLELLLNKVH